MPPEVYGIFDQIISALGVPSVISATYTPTALGASLRRATLRDGDLLATGRTQSFMLPVQ